MTTKIRNTRLRIVLVAIVTALAVMALLMSRQSPCEPGGSSIKGQVRRDAKGTLEYFDGRCWATKPPAPGDQPF